MLRRAPVTCGARRSGPTMSSFRHRRSPLYDICMRRRDYAAVIELVKRNLDESSRCSSDDDGMMGRCIARAARMTEIHRCSNGDGCE
jgi:hypothetical protein